MAIHKKYIKQEDYEKDNSLLKQKQEQAKEQLQKYKNTEEIKMLPKLKSYAAIVIKDRIEYEEIN